MIQIIAGKKGSGKTKRLIDLTNSTAKESNSDVIFLDDDNRYMFDVDHKVRFVNVADYHVNSPEMFTGFLCGMLSSNFDIGTIFVDSFLKLCKKELAESEGIVNTLKELCDKHNVNFVLSLSADLAEVPEFMKEYLI